MARQARLARQAKKTDVYLAPKVDLKPLEILKLALVLVGKPLFFILSHLIIAGLFLLYLIGHTTRVAQALKIQKTKIKKVVLKLLFLKFSLFFVRVIDFLAKIRIPRPKLVLRLRPLLTILLIISSGFVFYYVILRGLPSPKQLTNREIEVSTKIYDRNGILLYKIYKDKNRTIVPLEKIPLQVRLATLAAEDAEFYNHIGFSIRGMLRAAIRNFKRGELSGGSTITQQLVKNALLSSEKTFVRKLREIILSVGVELTFTKDRILEMYLNEVSYGGTAYGIQEAARVYFAKDVGELSLSEAALLASLPKSPTKSSPFGQNPDLALNRQKEVLNLMRINKFITADEEEAALKEKLVFAPNKTDIKAPHFVMYIRGQLVDKYGEEMVEKGGFEVTTSLDYGIQKLAEGVVKAEVEKLANLNVTNGAVLILNPQTGEILAMVGSKDYFDTAHDGNVNVTLRQRQPGSSIKVVNYSYALSNGYTPATILDDTPVTFAVSGQPPYTPRNYDGAYRGKITLRSALAESRNIPAVKVLASYGVSKMLEQGKKMGINSWTDPRSYGLSLTLGGGDVTLLELARVYATIANYGKRPEISSILEVKNYKGEVLQKNDCISKIEQAGLITNVQGADAAKSPCENEQVVDPRVAYLLIDILRDNNARAPAFGSSSALVIPGHPEVAVKTGTSNDLKDNLTVGFNKKYLVASWVGNNNNSPMARVASGVTGASPIWNKIVRALLASEPNHPWETPQGLVRLPICTLTGTLTCEGCPTRMEWFLEGKRPAKACSPGQILEPAASTVGSP